MWKRGLGEKLIYSTQKLTKSKQKDNSVPIIILMLSSTLTDFLFFILLIVACNFYFFYFVSGWCVA